MLKHVPNALTILRLVLAPVIAFAVWQAYAVTSEGGSSPFWPLPTRIRPGTPWPRPSIT